MRGLELARLALTKPNTIRVRLCETGHFYGIRPLKLPSGKLLWPADSLDRLAAYKAKGGAV